MKFGQQENIRVKEQIVDGFFEQLKIQPFSEIRVAQLIKAAGVARVSYYRNFDSIEDILNFYLTSLVVHHRQEKSEEKPKHSRKPEIIKAKFEEAFCSFKKEKERFILLIDRGLSSHIYEFFVNFGEILHAQHGGSQRPLTYKHIFIFGASFHVMMAWLQNGTKESPAEMADFLVKTLPSSFFD